MLSPAGSALPIDKIKELIGPTSDSAVATLTEAGDLIQNEVVPLLNDTVLPVRAGTCMRPVVPPCYKHPGARRRRHRAPSSPALRLLIPALAPRPLQAIQSVYESQDWTLQLEDKWRYIVVAGEEGATGQQNQRESSWAVGPCAEEEA